MKTRVYQRDGHAWALYNTDNKDSRNDKSVEDGCGKVT